MIESETDKAWEENKVKLTEAEEKKQEVKERMAELRSRKKPPKMVGVHPTVLALPDDNNLSYKNVKKWIETQQGIARSAGQVERSRNKDVPQKKRDQAMRERMGAEGYIRIIKYYIRTGDWTGMFWGEHEQNPTKWRVIAPAGEDINSSK